MSKSNTAYNTWCHATEVWKSGGAISKNLFEKFFEGNKKNFFDVEMLRWQTRTSYCGANGCK